LEDMKVDHMVRAQMAQYQAPPPAYNMNPMAVATAPTPGYSLPAPTAPGSNAHMYPALGDYMGLELSQDVIALNMPEYQLQTVHSGGAVSNLIAPISSQSVSLAKATVTGAIRQVVLCKDKDGRCGLRLHSVNNGVFVCYVQAGSPAALVGLRFGDQILEINNVALAGMTMDQCHGLLKKAPTNGITMAVSKDNNN
ncbi:syntenin-1-like, partial [Pectinophora gossypiella]|uniref:syntenin-1-like n=1 Tax=Pectinophora gossypiella TaxID=13191 RepID=UPI00214F1D1E